MSLTRPATTICFGIAALFVAAMHGPVQAQAGQATPPAPSPELPVERDAVQSAENLHLRTSYEQQCRRLLEAVSGQRQIEFSHASDKLKSSTFSLLDGLVQIATDCPSAAISITGHTDSSGDDRSNLQLSKARADSVVAYLVSRGIAAGRLLSFGAGSTQPLVDENSARARAKNRRIEFEFCFPARE